MKRIKYKGQIYEAVNKRSIQPFYVDGEEVKKEFDNHFGIGAIYDDGDSPYYYGNLNELKSWIKWLNEQGLRDGYDYCYSLDDDNAEKVMMMNPDEVKGALSFIFECDPEFFDNTWRRQYLSRR